MPWDSKGTENAARDTQNAARDTWPNPFVFISYGFYAYLHNRGPPENAARDT